MFLTAEDMAEHLRFAIDDEAAITAMVQRKFPDYVQRPRSFPPKPVKPVAVSSPVDPWGLQNERAMKMGSDNLLAALWRSHPRVLRSLEAQGKVVVRQ